MAEGWCNLPVGSYLVVLTNYGKERTRASDSHRAEKKGTLVYCTPFELAGALSTADVLEPPTEIRIKNELSGFSNSTNAHEYQ